MAEEFVGSGIGFPVRTDPTGSVALVSGQTEIRESVRLIVGTAYGERPMRPEFGCRLHEFVFEMVDAYTVGRIKDEVLAALERWEPRIDVLEVECDLSALEQGRVLIDITYALRATNDVRNLVYPFYLVPQEEEL